MKIVPSSKSRNAVSSVSKPRQQLIQTLEPRRLMSLSGAPEFAPPMQAPTQFTHAFGFENLLPPPPQAGGQGASFALITAPLITGGDATESTTSSAHSVSQAVSIDTTSDNTAVPTPAPATGTSLSAMYAALNHSTVASIDEAESTDAGSAFTTAVSSTSSAVQNPTLATVNGSSEAVVVEKTGSTPTSPAAAVAGEAVPSPVTLPATSGLLPSAAATENLIPQTSFARTLETELQSVSALAREMVSQLGRNLAIELAHIESAADSAVIEQLNAPWDGWRTAAVAGAAIATAAYLQSETNSDGSKNKSVFSNRMIEAFAT